MRAHDHKKAKTKVTQGHKNNNKKQPITKKQKTKNPQTNKRITGDGRNRIKELDQTLPAPG